MSLQPRYLQLRTMLLERIMEGSYGPGMKIPNEPDIADEFGVSRMTANRAILSLVSDGWLYRKKRAGTFVVDPQAEMALRPVRPVVAIPDLERTLDDEYFQGLYWALHARISARGGSLAVVNLPEMHRVELLESHRPDPLILLAPPRTFHDDILEIARNGTRVLLLNTTLQGYGMVALDSDNIFGPALVVNHLAELGHRRIAFLGAYPEDANTVDRLRGFRAALGACGIPHRPEHMFVTREGLLERDPALRTEMVKMLETEPRPTAIFAAGAHLALEVLSLASKLGLNVPRDLSVVGYDDPPFAARSTPALTTVKQPHLQMAAYAAELIYSQGSVAPETCTLFEPTLVVRASSGRVAQEGNV